ncbi:MAG: hypothetical protein ACI4EN_07590 [Butyrivibrio sp.]
MIKSRTSKIILLICLGCVIALGIYMAVKHFGTEKTVPDNQPGQTTNQADTYPEELKPYVDAIKFFESEDWNSWNNMLETSPLFTEEAFVQSLYHLGKIDMSKYDSGQKGIQDISKNIEDAKSALNYLIKSLNGEPSYDTYEGSLMLSKAINNMKETKAEAERLKEKYEKKD